MAKLIIVVLLALLGGAIPLSPVSAQDDLPLPIPKPTLYGVGEIGHWPVPNSVPQAAELDRQADDLRKAGNPDAAQKLYRQAIAVAPLVEAYKHYADYLATHGNPAKAAEIYQYVIVPLPKTPESQQALQPVELFRLALYLSEAGKTQEAFRIYQYAIVCNGGNDGSLPKLNFVSKQGFDKVLFEAACHLGTGIELTNRSDPDFPTATPSDRTEIIEATHIKPDWAEAWYVLATEMDKEISEHYGATPALAGVNIKLGCDAATHYLDLAKRSNSGEDPLRIQQAEAWRNLWSNPKWVKSITSK